MEKTIKNGTSSTINATDYTNEDDKEDINAVRYQNNYRRNSNKGGRSSYNNMGNRGGANSYNPNSNKGGQQTSQYQGNSNRRINLYGGNRGGNSKTSFQQSAANNTANQQAQQGQKPKDMCRYCKKPGHTIEDCWTLQAKNKARGVNQVDQSQQQDEEFEEHSEEVSSIFNSKN